MVFPNPAKKGYLDIVGIKICEKNSKIRSIVFAHFETYTRSTELGVL